MTRAVAPEGPGAVEEWIDHLTVEPRMTAITGAGPDHLVLSVDSRVGRGSRPDLLVYTADGAGWRPSRVLRGAVQPVGCRPGELVHLRPAAGGFTVHHERLDRADAPSREIGRLPGRVGGMVWRADRGDLLLTALTGAEPPAGVLAPFPPGVAVHTTDANFAFGHARAGSASWQLWTLNPSDGPRRLPLTPPEGCRLTGEVAWLAGGRVVAGVLREAADGSRRHGLAVWDDPAAAPQASPREVWLDGRDLTAPLTAPDGSVLAVLVSTGGFGPEPLAHHPAVLDADLLVTSLPADPQVWTVPACWLSPTRLVSLAERHSTRHLVVNDLTDASHRPLPARESVLSVASVGPRAVATLDSRVDRPPALAVRKVAGEAGNRQPVEESGPPPGGPRSADRQVVERDGVRLGYTLCGPGGDTSRGLIAMFHGGPTMSWSDWSWRWSPWPYVAAGFTVLMLEPPMSCGYGPDSQRAGWRSWSTGIGGHAEWLLETARRRHGLTGLPLITMGGSFGGYLALRTATRLPVDLVVTHAAPLDLESVAYGSEVFWSWVREYGHPLHEGLRYAEQSVRLAEIPVTTRVLLSHGVDDDTVPCGQAVRAHRLLRGNGVPSELVLLRGEGHAVRARETIAECYRWALHACAAVTATPHVLSANP